MRQFDQIVFQPGPGPQALSPSRARGWTPALRRLFLDRLSRMGEVRSAAKACGLSRQSVYSLRRRDESFAREWDAVLMERSDRQEREFAALVEELCRRAGLASMGNGPAK